MPIANGSDLIEDHEVSSIDGDRLNHQAFAAQLAELVVATPTPANIALFGPWGSGKSSVGALLSSILETRKDTRFIRFDAFKYAENPLRRNFISVTAEELGQRSESVVVDLYAAATENKLRVDGPLLKSALAVTGIIFGVILTGLIFVVLAAALLSCIVSGWTSGAGWNGDPYLERVVDLLGASFPALVLSAGIVAGLMTLVGKTFTVEHTTDPVQSDEEFERAFQDVLKKAKGGPERFVFFIDELDRCQPHEVVGTLSAIRTFFGVDKCVFVVAADRQVLEQALNIASRQATPLDEVNPYYSEGSEYLDKVFQYQLSLPPLFRQSVTRFALDAVKGKQGIWLQVQAPAVVTALIPSHVRSPRRVKHLLNAYVLAAQSAISRQDAGLIGDVFPERALELARLVCLQVEFPALARDLAEEPELPAMILAASEHFEPGEIIYEEEDEPPVTTNVHLVVDRFSSEWWTSNGWGGTSPRMRRRAIEYATGKLASATVLAKEAGSGGESIHQVQTAQATQLVNYLSRTQRIDGPRRDLIFLKSLGATFGLPVNVAESLVEAAENFRVSAIREVMADGASGYAILELLSDVLTNTASDENVAMSVVAFSAELGRIPPEQADLVVAALEHRGMPIPTSSDLADDISLGLLQLAAACSGLSHIEGLEEFVLGDPNLRASVGAWELLGSDRWWASSPSTLGQTLAACLTVDREPSLLEGATLPEARLTSLLSLAHGSLAEYAGDKELAPILLANLVAGLVDGRRSAEARDGLVGALISMGAGGPLEGLEAALPTIPRTANAELAHKMIERGMRHRPLASWPAWMAAIADEAWREPVLGEALAGLAGIAWERGLAEPGPETVRVVELTGAHLGSGTGPRAEFSDEVAVTLESVSVAASPTRNALERSDVLQLAAVFSRSGLLDPDSLASNEASELVAVLSAPLPAQSSASPLGEYVVRAAEFVALSEQVIDRGNADGLCDALRGCAWLDLESRCWASVALESSPALGEARPETATHLKELLSQEASETAQRITARWIEGTTPSSQSLFATAGVLFHLESPSDEFVSAVRSWAAEDVGERRTQLVELLLDLSRGQIPSDWVWSPLELTSFEPTRRVELLAHHASTATTTAEVHALMNVCEKVRGGKAPEIALLWRTVLRPLVNNSSLPGEAHVAVLEALPALLRPLPGGVRDDVKASLEGLRSKVEALSPSIDKALKATFPNTKFGVTMPWGGGEQ